MNVTRTERDFSDEKKNVKIAMNKSLLKEFKKTDNNGVNERVVYLEDEDEFQIQIFNDQETEIGAKIFVNDELIGNSLLVIRPGERVWLDRYLDRALKFKFKTYEVNGNSRDVQRAIRNNGVVKVMLYRKQKEYNYVYTDWTYRPFKMEEYPTYPQIYYCNEPSFSVSSCDLSLGNADYYCGSINNVPSSNIAEYSTSTFTTTTKSDVNTTLGKTRSLSSNKIETGRIQEGSASDQEFDYVDMSFETFAFDTETIHILPKSTKPTKASDLQKIYCTNCGRRLKTKFNYCPYCGEKLD